MSELSITTTQNVTINFNSASIGDRVAAQVVDLAIKVAYLVVIYMVVFKNFGIEQAVDNMDRWSGIAVHTLLSFPAIFYSLALESMFEGQTVGKRLRDIRVIKIDGYQAGFGDYFIRWIMRIPEINLSIGLVGIITMVVSDKNQRLGDMAAGTAVITLRNNISIDHTILQELNDDYVPTYPLVIKLSDNDVRIIKETYDMSLSATDFAMIDRLKDKIETVTGIQPLVASSTDFVATILKDYNYYTQKM